MQRLRAFGERDMPDLEQTFAAPLSAREAVAQATDDIIETDRVVGRSAEMTGREANQLIVDQYVAIDQQMQQFLGDPPVANWTTFGKFAGREAGQAIARLEMSIAALDNFDIGAGAGALSDLVTNFSEMGPYLGPLLGETYRQTFGQDPPDGITDLGGMVEGAWDVASAAFHTATFGVFGGDTIPEKAAEFRDNLLANLQTLRDGLVEANVGINNNFQPAFEAFLTAEQSGLDGVAAVQTLVDEGVVADPDGLVVEAMGLYQQANRLNARIAGNPDDTSLVSERQAMIERANLLIGIQEQHHVAQQGVFDRPEFGRLVELVTPALQVRDANGVNQLLPNGGNWAEFTDRMGFEEVSAREAEALFTGNGDLGQELFAVTDPATGDKRYYRPSDDPKKLEGTIYGYFTHGATGPAAEANMAAAPSAIGSDASQEVRELLLDGCDPEDPEAFARVAEMVRVTDPQLGWALDALADPAVSPAVRQQMVHALRDDKDTGDDFNEGLGAAGSPEDFAAIAAAYRAKGEYGQASRVAALSRGELSEGVRKDLVLALKDDNDTTGDYRDALKNASTEADFEAVAALSGWAVRRVGQANGDVQQKIREAFQDDDETREDIEVALERAAGPGDYAAIEDAARALGFDDLAEEAASRA